MLWPAQILCVSGSCPDAPFLFAENFGSDWLCFLGTLALNPDHVAGSAEALGSGTSAFIGPEKVANFEAILLGLFSLPLRPLKVLGLLSWDSLEALGLEKRVDRRVLSQLFHLRSTLPRPSGVGLRNRPSSPVGTISPTLLRNPHKLLEFHLFKLI